MVRIEKAELTAGTRHSYRGHPVRLRRVLDLNLVLGEYEATGHFVNIPIKDLKPAEEVQEQHAPQDDILSVPEKDWVKARQRLAILQPVLAARGDRTVVAEACRTHKLGKSTIYRWLKLYEEAGSVRALVDLPRSGGKDKPRLDEVRTVLIQEAIETHYLTKQKKQPSEVVLEVQRLCYQAGISPPAGSTIRRRIRLVDGEETTRRRLGNKAARERYKPQEGGFPDADYPLQVVELDHTVVDIMLVDEVYRNAVGRPYLTMAIDVYSRVIMGIYLSFDPPGAIGTGLCVAHMLLPKEEWLTRIEVEGEWPCWGRPGALHLDNAKEFRGEMMQRACEKYGIRLEFRPVRTPEYGGHIERLMGTCMRKVHTLPGTTFSNPQQRGEYNAEKMAALTLREFEQWLTTYITNVYHKSVHSGTGQIPLERFRDGILGTPDLPGIGLPERLNDERQVRLDFMPAILRSVQQYGVQVDHIHYYADVLRSYIDRLEPGSGRQRDKWQLTFKRDPRDISVLYLLEPGTYLYHRVPYRDTSRPVMSIWEHRVVIRQLKKQGVEKLDEAAIFAAYDRMKEIELAALAKTQRMTPGTRRMLRGVPLEQLAAHIQSGLSPEVLAGVTSPTPQEVPLDISTLKPFDDLEVSGL